MQAPSPEPGVKPATGEAVTVASAGSPQDDSGHAPMVTSLAGTSKRADQTRNCARLVNNAGCSRERAHRRRDHARGSGPRRRPGTSGPVVYHATAVAGPERREEDGQRTWLNGGAGLSRTTGVAPDRAASRWAGGRRSRRSTGSHGLLFRRLRWRRLEDDRRWHVLGERLRRLL